MRGQRAVLGYGTLGYGPRIAGCCALVALAACGGLDAPDPTLPQAGKADGVLDRYELDLAALQRGVEEQVADDHMTWPPLASDDWRDLFVTRVAIAPDKTLTARSHLFGGDRWVPHADQGLLTTTQQGVRFADGQVSTAIAGDEALAAALCTHGEGDLGISLKHEGPEFPILDPRAADKEAFKLFDTHIQIWTCVRDAAGKLRVFTLNNPTNYAKSSQALDGSGFSQPKIYGAFGTRAYGNIFLRFNYDRLAQSSGMTVAREGGAELPLWRAFQDNIRTMAVLFNSISWFPVDYNGNDPLAAHSPARVREHVAMAIHALIGTPGARDWWLGDKSHYIYCAELAYLSAAAGLLVPLNEAHVVGLHAPDGFPTITAADFAKFTAELAKHNAHVGTRGPLSQAQLAATYIGAKNRTNTGIDPNAPGGRFKDFVPGAISRVPLALAPAALQSFAAYTDRAAECAAPANQDRPDCLAFTPLTVADMVRHFIGIFIPRHETDALPAPQRAATQAMYGQIQAQMLYGMKDALYESMSLPAGHPGRTAISDVIDGLTGCAQPVDGACGPSVITRTYPGYAEFIAALEQDPFYLAAQQIASAGDKSSSFFTPPSLFHLAALKRSGGLLGMDYVTHGMHFSLVQPTGGVTPSQPPAGPGTSAIPYTGDSCYDLTDRGKQDHSMHGCVDVSSAAFATSACAGHTVTGYCPGAANIQCCVR